MSSLRRRAGSSMTFGEYKPRTLGRCGNAHREALYNSANMRPEALSESIHDPTYLFDMQNIDWAAA